jgi:hypothetical protein
MPSDEASPVSPRRVRCGVRARARSRVVVCRSARAHVHTQRPRARERDDLQRFARARARPAARRARRGDEPDRMARRERQPGRDVRDRRGPDGAGRRVGRRAELRLRSAQARDAARQVRRPASDRRARQAGCGTSGHRVRDAPCEQRRRRIAIRGPHRDRARGKPYRVSVDPRQLTRPADARARSREHCGRDARSRPQLPHGRPRMARGLRGRRVAGGGSHGPQRPRDAREHDGHDVSRRARATGRGERQRAAADSRDT